MDRDLMRYEATSIFYFYFDDGGYLELELEATYLQLAASCKHCSCWKLEVGTCTY